MSRLSYAVVCRAPQTCMFSWQHVRPRGDYGGRLQANTALLFGKLLLRWLQKCQEPGDTNNWLTEGWLTTVYVLRPQVRFHNILCGQHYVHHRFVSIENKSFLYSSAISLFGGASELYTDWNICPRGIRCSGDDGNVWSQGDSKAGLLFSLSLLSRYPQAQAPRILTFRI